MLFLSIIPWLLATALAGYDPNAKNNLVVYWGQGSNQESLGYYCEKGIMDIVVVSFVNIITPSTVAFNFGNACFGAECPLIARDIKICQSMGIKVLLSFGGDLRMGNFALSSDSGAEQAAQYIYDMFNVKSTSKVIKPFGSDVQIDGFDLDVENWNQDGQIAFYKKLRSLWGSDELLLSACPQCPHPDNNVGKVIDSGEVDLVFMQFYSNPSCSLMESSSAFTSSWDTWIGVCDTVLATYNKQIKFFAGVQAACTNDYHVNLAYVTEQMLDKKSSKYFAGFSAWDATVGSACTDSSLGESLNYLAGLKLISSDVYDSKYSKRDEL